MKKTKTIVAKALAIILTTGVLSVSSPFQAAHAATAPNTQIQKSQSKNGAFEDDNFKVTETDNSRIVIDKKTNKKVTVTFTDAKHSQGTYTDVNGNVKKLSTDANGSIYLDNECIVNATRTILPLNKKSGVHPTFIGDDGFDYHYVSYVTYDTKTQGDAEAIAIGVLGVLPGLGYIFAVAGIIETARNYGADTLYISQYQYCTADYSHYAYKNYFYTDKGHSNLIKATTTYKKMF